MTNLLDWAGKEAMTYYDAGQLLIAAGKAIKDIPGAIVRNADQSLVDAQALIDRAKDAIKLSAQVMGEIEKGELALCERYDHLYRTIQKKRRETAEKIKALEPMPECRLPYNLDEMFKVADRLSELTKEQFDRLIELAKALAGPRS